MNDDTVAPDPVSDSVEATLRTAADAIARTRALIERSRALLNGSAQEIADAESSTHTMAELGAASGDER